MEAPPLPNVIDRIIYGIIYVIFSTVDHLEYVGKTRKTMHDRRLSHQSDLKRFKTYVHTPGTRKRNFCTYLYRAMIKHGPGKFTMRQIDVAYSKKELDDLETYYIEERNTLAPNGYNLTTGGDGGYVHSPEITALISENTKKGIHANIDKLRKNELSKGLPVHVQYAKISGGYCFLIQDHPLCKYRAFMIKYYETIEDARMDCLIFLDGLYIDGVLYIAPSTKENGLPKNIRKIKGGYKVVKKHKGITYHKNFANQLHTDDENLENAKKHLKTLINSWK